MPDCEVLVLGAGAAGLMCAATAGQRGRRVIVLENNQEPGKKILISGGGRCNFTNLHCTANNFLSRNPHFAKSALARYTVQDWIKLVAKHGIAYHEKTLGQLFCDRSSREIVDLLLNECRAGRVELVNGIQINAVTKPHRWSVQTSRGEYTADSLVIATGGLSIPKIGATGFGLDIARQFGHAIVDPWPALVPLTFNADDQRRFGDLPGVAAEVVAAHGKQRFRERLLITHRGLSGPAVLQISSYWRGQGALRFDLLPSTDLAADLKERKDRGERLELKTVLAEHLPKRLADRWAELRGGSRPLHQLSHTTLAQVARSLHDWQVMPAGTEGYAKAEVMGGGVDTAGLSSQTMESKHQPGLFFVGEVVDVTGHLGGFNFQWAWSSGWVAGSVA